EGGGPARTRPRSTCPKGRVGGGSTCPCAADGAACPAARRCPGCCGADAASSKTERGASVTPDRPRGPCVQPAKDAGAIPSPHLGPARISATSHTRSSTHYNLWLGPGATLSPQSFSVPRGREKAGAVGPLLAGVDQVWLTDGTVREAL